MRFIVQVDRDILTKRCCSGTQLCMFMLNPSTGLRGLLVVCALKFALFNGSIVFGKKHVRTAVDLGSLINDVSTHCPENTDPHHAELFPEVICASQLCSIHF